MLLKNLIKVSDSRSIVIPTPGKLVKLVLSVLGGIGFELMYKEQYMIADENYILDIKETKKELDWEPIYSYGHMIIEAYNEWDE
ncbi:MAG: NAD(P)-dependent oxidoreductase [Firmicutes bacterium]|nr:NAD(P)-dependent oxidoreductase [Bacillota bacterium]